MTNASNTECLGSDMDCGRSLPCPDHPAGPSEQLRAAARKLTHPMQLCSHGDDSDACQLAHAQGHPVPAVGPSYAEVMAERYTDAAGNAKGRAGQVARLYATLHALMAFLDAHPDLPIPYSVCLGFTGVDMELLQHLAAQHGTDVYPAGDPQQVTVWPIGKWPDAEFWMPYIIALARPDRPL